MTLIKINIQVKPFLKKMVMLGSLCLQVNSRHASNELSPKSWAFLHSHVRQYLIDPTARLRSTSINPSP